MRGKTMKEYGQFWGYSPSHTYRLLACGKINRALAPLWKEGCPRPRTVWQLRPLFRLTEEQQREAWRRAHRTSTEFQGDTHPMRRAVAFSRSIKDSQAFTRQFAQIIQAYRETHPEAEDLLHCELDHVDGTYNALKRNELLDWLKAETPEKTCRILSNARCLSEGVDVPALDAVMFLNPRNSIVDVVQSVGRVMRKAEGKQFGYIILPIGIPADMAPEEALKDHQKYKVVWQVLQALRAHDDRFNATVNQIELNKKRPAAIQIIGIGGEEPGQQHDGDGKPKKTQETQGSFFFPQLDEWKDAIYAKIVLKCGDRRYWESWAKDVAVIAERHTRPHQSLARKR